MCPKEFEGMDVDKTRKAVLESLKVEEYLRGEET